MSEQTYPNYRTYGIAENGNAPGGITLEWRVNDVDRPLAWILGHALEDRGNVRAPAFVHLLELVLGDLLYPGGTLGEVCRTCGDVVSCGERHYVDLCTEMQCQKTRCHSKVVYRTIVSFFIGNTMKCYRTGLVSLPHSQSDVYFSYLAGPHEARRGRSQLRLEPRRFELRIGYQASIRDRVAERGPVVLSAQHELAYGALDPVRTKHDVGLVRRPVQEVQEGAAGIGGRLRDGHETLVEMTRAAVHHTDERVEESRSA